VDNTEEYRAISLCTGYAGIELGLERIIPNLRTVCYVEVEAFACANLVAKIEQGKLAEAPIWTDIKTFDGRPFRNRVHIITGGYPCQPFSLAGKRKGTKDPRHLWPYIEGIIQAVRPVWCFFENVGGHLTSGFPEVYRSLRIMGYDIEAGLFSSASCGATHRRERLFILAHTQYYDELNCEEKKCDGIEEGKKVFCKSQGRERWMLKPQRMGGGLWPSGPKQGQAEWEERRTIKPTMDRTNDGNSCWVDRLRLLGNGVVPQCAELAFRTLIRKFE